jgi:hypothetical protein
MPEYRFTAERSRAKEHTVRGITCGHAAVSGEFDAEDVKEAYARICEICVIPGTWWIRMISNKRHLKGRYFRRYPQPS